MYVPLLLLLVHQIQSRVVTFRLQPSGKECYYAMTAKEGQKLGFYFNVQSGGDFLVDYYVKDPNSENLFDGKDQSNLDIVLTANKIGEYMMCFFNTGTNEEKMIDFEIMIEGDDHKATLPISHPLDAEKRSNMEESLFKIKAALQQIDRDQRYFRSREHRNMSTVQSTEGRIFWGAITGSVLAVVLGLGQVWVIRTLFGGAKRAGL